MESIKTRAVVARRTDYAESNCMLTLFAEELGVISACAYGIKGKKSRLRAVAQPLCFAEFVLVKGGGDIYRVEAADIIEAFYPISEDIEKLALANYFIELSGDNFSAADGRILSLLLNTLYALAYKETESLVVKAVFELKMMQYSGYEPSLDACIKCGSGESLVCFDFAGGAVCADCAKDFNKKLSADTRACIKYILNADIKKLFSFTLSKESQKNLSDICESYLLSKSEKHYKSLEYYKKIK